MARRGMSEADIARVRAWCDTMTPAHLRDQVRIECEIGARHVTIVDRRPGWPDKDDSEWTTLPVARLRFENAVWSLFWCDRNSRFHRYAFTEPSADVGALLDEIDHDPTCIFWG